MHDSYEPRHPATMVTRFFIGLIMYTERLIEERLMMDVKPHRLKFLLRLGVPEEFAKQFTIRQSSKVIKRKLTHLIGKKPGLMSFYRLWTHGIPLEVLKTMTLEEVNQMLNQIWASEAYKKMYPYPHPTIA